MGWGSGDQTRGLILSNELFTHNNEWESERASMCCIKTICILYFRRFPGIVGINESPGPARLSLIFFIEPATRTPTWILSDHKHTIVVVVVHLSAQIKLIIYTHLMSCALKFWASEDWWTVAKSMKSHGNAFNRLILARMRQTGSLHVENPRLPLDMSVCRFHNDTSVTIFETMHQSYILFWQLKYRICSVMENVNHR